MTCFIILHYIAFEATLECINSIKKLSGEKEIIVVDNCSPNNTGIQLQQYYVNDNHIQVILNDSNLGFAKGHNIGFEYAKKHFDPEYYVFLNNDIVILQKDFINLINSSFIRYGFDVLGPDVFSTSLNKHQSPKSLHRTTIHNSRLLLKKYEKRLSSKVLVPIRAYVKQLPFLLNLFLYIKRDKGIHYDQMYYNVPIHGSCIIMTKRFLSSRNYAFFPDTFLYYESEILDYECNIGGFKTLYNPNLYVIHHQNVSTKIEYKSTINRVRFMNINIYDSIKSFLNHYS